MNEQPSQRGRVMGRLFGAAVVVVLAFVTPHLPHRVAIAGGLVAFSVLCPVLYFRFCRDCWREFKTGVADAGGWSIRRSVASRNCPMCGAVVATSSMQCSACGETLPTDNSLMWLPAGVRLTGIAVMVLVPALVIAAIWAAAYVLGA